MEQEEEIFEGYIGIEEFLLKQGNGCPVEIPSELDFIVDELSAKYSLSKEKSKRILTLFFQEIRTKMLEGKIISLIDFGRFYIHLGSKKCFPTFKPHFYLKNKIKYAK